MPSLLETLIRIEADEIAGVNLKEQNGAPSAAKTQCSQRRHRMDILKSWLEMSNDVGHDLDGDIIAKTTLDIGCGQGDMTALFASILSAHGDEKSKVIGVDPARLDYGSPWTLGQAQEYLSSGPLKSHLSFVQAFAPDLISSKPAGTYCTAMFAHSLYYLPSAATLIKTLRALREAGVKTLLLAEWGLSISRPAALPHLLAVLLQTVDPLPEGNIRTVLSPAAYIEAAKEAGWEHIASKTITPASGVEDGKWEVSIARNLVKGWDLDRGFHDNEERSADAVKFESLKAHSAAMEMSIPEQNTAEIAPMDVWTAIFRPAT